MKCCLWLYTYILLKQLLLQSINSLIAKKMIDDRSREYMSARRVAKEYEVATRGLDKNAPSVPPQNTYNEMKQVHSIPRSCIMIYSYLFI